MAILTTGDELVPVDSEPGPGQIRNSNAPMLAALVAAAGGEPWVLPTAADRRRRSGRGAREAMEADLLLISGGVSAGKFDLVEPALARMGARFHFTGVRIQPGKPLVFGEVPRDGRSRGAGKLDSLPFFGLPGNPVSSAVTFLLFGAPVLAALAGMSEVGPRFALAQLAADTDRRTKPGLTRFLPAHCDFNPHRGKLPQVETVPWQGSGDLAAFARSNCFLVVPDEVEQPEGRRDGPYSVDLRSSRCPIPQDRNSRTSMNPATPRMVDVSAKQATRRTATASAFVELSAAVLAALPENPKGNPLEVARFAGIQAAKRTSELIPMCHPLALTHVDVQAEIAEGGVRITATAATVGPTGVEMEALTAAAVAALTVYDMTKALDKGIVIRNVQLEAKTGGKSGDFVRSAATGMRRDPRA